MSAVIVHHHMQGQLSGILVVQSAQELQPFLMAVPGVALAYHLALQHVQGRKQCRCTVALVVMSEGAAQRPFFSGNPG